MSITRTPVRVAALALGLTLPVTAATATEWTMATPYADAVFHTENVRAFAADVEEATGGDLTITVNSGGSLIPHPSIKRSLQDGIIQIGEVLMSLLENENALYGVDAIPFLATGYDDARALWEASRQPIAEILADEGLVLLYAVPWQPQSFYTAEPVTAVADFDGLRMRTYNTATARMAELLGATPTQVETPEIPQAFSTGMVDAMITSPATGVSSQAWDFVDHFTEVRAWLPKNMVVVSAAALGALDADTRAAVVEAAARAEERGWARSEELMVSLTETLAENGMTVTEPSAELMADLQAIGATMAAEWAENAGEAGAAILEAYAN